MDEPGVILLMGATATGKTELALAIAQRFDVEIISVDSALIFRGMDIGTAKPDATMRAAVPHHLIDILDPAYRWSVWEFVEACTRLVAEISARGRIPLLAGGTMMYYNAFERGLNRLPAADPELRRQLDNEAREQGLAVLHRRLQEIDAPSAARIRATDAQRIQRALEVYHLTGQPLSVLQRQTTSGYAGRKVKIHLEAGDRAQLHRRIEIRFRSMLEQGFMQGGLIKQGIMVPERLIGQTQTQHIRGYYPEMSGQLRPEFMPVP